MITELRVGNFKAFADTQKVPIKPLTLIFGPNSAGKSSLIHSIALASQAIATGDLDVYRTTVGGEAIDLGGFRQYVHKRKSDHSVEWAIDLNVSKFSGRIAELLSSIKTVSIALIFGVYSSPEEEPSEPISEEKEKELLEKLNEIDKKELKAIMDEVFRYRPSILRCEVAGDGNALMRVSRRRDGSYRFDILEPDHSVLRNIFNAIVEVYTTSTSFSETDYEGFKEAVNDLLAELSVKIDRFLPRQILKNGSPLDASPSFLAAVGKGTRKENLIDATKSFLPSILNELIQELSKTIEDEIGRFQYLGPLRSYPPRHIAFSQHGDINWYAGGGYAWDVVRKDFKIRKKVNEWLGDKNKLSTLYELVVRHLLTIDDIKKDYSEVIDDISYRFSESEYEEDLFGEIYDALERVKNSEAKISDVQELNLVDLRSNTVVSHRDVGIGISQVLPVLVGAYAAENKIIAIEQPEIHLHPALQAELGDVFIESALGENKNTYVLETHSEHLILRILRRIRETANGELPEGHKPIKPSDVAVIFAEPTPKGTILKELRITEDGEFADKWPGGFFPERAKELF